MIMKTTISVFDGKFCKSDDLEKGHNVTNEELLALVL